MDDLGKFALLSVDLQRSRLRRHPIEYLSASINRHGKIRARMPHDIPEAVAVHHQQVQCCKAAAAEQLGQSVI